MKSAGKARNNGLYRHIRTSKEIIRNLLNDSLKDLYDVLPKNAPANENVKREPQEYSIGPYTIVVEGTDNEE